MAQVPSQVPSLFAQSSRIDSTAGLNAWVIHAHKATTWMRLHDGPTRLWSPFGDSRASGVAVIIETRKHPLLEFVLRNAAQMLAPQNWALVIFCGRANQNFIQELVGAWPNVHLRCLGVEHMSEEQYSTFLTTRDFWASLLPHEHALLFQTDSIIMRPLQNPKLNPELSDGLESRLFQWAFVGAPWATTCFVCGSPIFAGVKCCGRKHDDELVHEAAPGLVGNGGFSLRRVKSMLWCLDHYYYPTSPHKARIPASSSPSAAASAASVSEEGVSTVTVQDPQILAARNEDTFFITALGRLKVFVNLRGGGGTLPPAFQVAPRTLALEFAAEQSLPLTLTRDTAWCVGSHKLYGYFGDAIVTAMLSAYSMTCQDTKNVFRDAAWITP